MYRRWLPFLTLATIFTGIVLGQTTPTEAETLRLLLMEVRQLRQTFLTTVATTQTIQLNLYHLQIQALAVSRATQRLDEARAKVAEAERWRKNLAGRAEDQENQLRHAQDQRERDNHELTLHQLKQDLEQRTAEEQQLRDIENEAKTALQGEQNKLTELQDTLDRAEKSVPRQNQP